MIRRMKDSEIYRRAAEIMDDPLHEFASCSAIANAFYGTQRNNDWPLGGSEYQELTEPFLDLFDGIQHTSLEQRNTRVLALCFMAAIAESEGR